jgi:hypothetical protein
MRFEKVSDIKSDFCHLDVFLADEKVASVDISLDENREVQFTIYPREQRIILTAKQWLEIFESAKEFAKKEIINEAAFKSWEKEKNGSGG